MLHNLLGSVYVFRVLSKFWRAKRNQVLPSSKDSIYLGCLLFLAILVLIACMVEKSNSSCIFILSRESDKSAITSSLRSCQSSVYHSTMGNSLSVCPSDIASTVASFFFTLSL